MKFIFTLFILSSLPFISKAQIRTQIITPTSIGNSVPGYSGITTINTKTFSYTPSIPPVPPNPIDDDTTTEDDKLYYYGDVLPNTILMSDGNITNTSVGLVWTIRISIPNALNIGFAFNPSNLSSSAQMFVFNESRTILKGSILKSSFVNTSLINIDPTKSNSIIIYIVEPNNHTTFQSNVTLTKIVAGYRDVSDVGDTGGQFSPLTASIDCDPTIMCRLDKINIARSVARFFYNIGTRAVYCSGTLLNNELNNGRPFFLTAFHCIDVGSPTFGYPGIRNGIIDQAEIDAISLASFQFQFWKTTCNGTSINLGLTFSGSVVRAQWNNSDGVLLELTNPPGVGDGVNYSGWNRGTSNPSNTGSFIIHHPQAEDMRITTTNNVRTFCIMANFGQHIIQAAL